MTQAAAASYLDPQTLAGISALDLRARMIVEGLMTGMHRSPYHGISVEFAEHRQYVQGDDLRHLDWKVFGRTDKLHLKQYQQETNLDLIILVDVSGSMSYASDRKTNWRKYDYAASITAAMGYLALNQQDRVGLVFFSDEVRDIVKPSNARGHWRSIIEALSRQTLQVKDTDAPRSDDKATDFERLFGQVTAQLTQRSVVMLVSDLFDSPQSIEQGLARLSHRRHDAIILQVLDHAERTFPFRSPSEFLGMEGEGRLRLDPTALREAYIESLNAHTLRIENVCRQFQFDHLLLDTSESLGPPLSQLLAMRAALARRIRRR